MDLKFDWRTERFNCELCELAPVVQRLDNAIHRINHYLLESLVCFANTYPLDCDLSSGYDSVIHPLNVPLNNCALTLTRPQSSSYNTRQRKSCPYPSHLALPFFGTHLSLRSSCALHEDDWGRVSKHFVCCKHLTFQSRRDAQRIMTAVSVHVSRIHYYLIIHLCVDATRVILKIRQLANAMVSFF